MTRNTDVPSSSSRKRNNDQKQEKNTVSLVIEAIVFLLLSGSVYVLASLLTPWTGIWGKNITTALVSRFSGSIVIPSLFVFFVLASVFFKRPIRRFFLQTMATLLLFVASAFLLGLLHASGVHWTHPVFRPGELGSFLSSFFLKNCGAFGSILIGFVAISISSMLYGLLDPRVVLAGVRSLFLRIANMVPNPLRKEASAPLNASAGTINRCPDAPSTMNVPDISEETPYQSTTPADDISGIRAPEERDASSDENPEPEFDVPDTPQTGTTPAGFPPSLDLFGPSVSPVTPEQSESIVTQGNGIISTLADFGVEAELAETIVGPTVIQFQLQLAPGIKVSRISGLANDLALTLAVPALRVEAPIPGKPFVGIEIPNPKRQGISLRTILESASFQNTEFRLPLPMGVRIDSRPLVIGLEELPHLLVAGTTGSGKSVFVNACINGLCACRPPSELRFLLVDPKRVEFSIYEHLPHMLTKPVVSAKKAVQALAWAVREMESRYEMFASARVRNLDSYNERVLPKDRLPSIVIVVDELADLMFTSPKEVEDYACRLAQMARATGIHLVLATQRPSVNVITGLIKANIPARVAFSLPSQTDSRTIIDTSGAERLLGKGDMLFTSTRHPRPIRLQSPFIDEDKTLALINALIEVFGEPEYVDIEDQENGNGSGNEANFTDDPLLEEATRIVIETGIASASRLQRQLRIGFTRAARIIDTLEQLGIVGPPEGSKPREILVDEERAVEILRDSTGE
jgi:S-DNA-T family DNA segregation ATPase FtsK/SpoIIIE